MTRALPSDAKLCRLVRYMEVKHAISIIDVERVLNLKPRMAWFYLDKLQDDGVIYLRYVDKRRKYYSLRTRDELRTTEQSPA